ncbi:unnamed protein product [Amoebophrya sp. A25]|nr:unnamed protein product [Amoebophrya sp. A25]|eukprot:GSA25T00026132001.1
MPPRPTSRGTSRGGSRPGSRSSKGRPGTGSSKPSTPKVDLGEVTGAGPKKERVYRPGCASHMEAPQPWQKLVLELTPGQQRERYNRKEVAEGARVSAAKGQRVTELGGAEAEADKLEELEREFAARGPQDILDLAKNTRDVCTAYPFSKIGSPNRAGASLSANYSPPQPRSPFRHMEYSPFENRGSCAVLGLHPGAHAYDTRSPKNAFYTPDYKTSGCKDSDYQLTGDYTGALSDKTIKYFREAGQSPYMPHRASADFYRSNAGDKRKDELLSPVSCYSRLFENDDPHASLPESEQQKQVHLARQRETQDFLQSKYRKGVVQQQAQQTAAIAAQRLEDIQAKAAEKKRLADMEFAVNASRRQEILDRRPPWKEPEPSPGPGERHPVLSDPNEAGGTVKELLYGIYTDGGKTLPPHLAADWQSPLHGNRTRFEYINRESGLVSPPRRFASLSPKEKDVRKKLVRKLRTFERAASVDAINASTGFIKRKRTDILVRDELDKWMHDAAGSPVPNSFYDLNGGGTLWK